MKKNITMEKEKIIIFLRDKRSEYLLELLKTSGYDAIAKGSKNEGELFKELDEAKIIITTIPWRKTEDEAKKIINTLKEKTIITGAMPNDDIMNLKSNDNKIIDLLKSDEVKNKNGKLTSECTIYSIIQMSNRAMFGLNVLLTGFGACAKPLYDNLTSFGSKVSVVIRNEKILKELKSNNIDVILFDELNKMTKNNLKKYDIIINTVPDEVFTRDLLSQFRSDISIYDIASTPCIKEYTKDIDYHQMLALPGKIVPKDAAKILFDKVESILKKENNYD